MVAYLIRRVLGMILLLFLLSLTVFFLFNMLLGVVAKVVLSFLMIGLAGLALLFS